jgi:tetratricopeptide (TPR) repeat protein
MDCLLICDSYREDGRAYQPYLQHALQSFPVQQHLVDLTYEDKVNVVGGLVEASRFSDNEWKKFAIAQAQSLLPDVDDLYMRASVAERINVLDRISHQERHPGIQRTTNMIDHISHQERQPGTPNNLCKVLGDNGSSNCHKLNSLHGHLIIQTAIDYIHADAPEMAIEKLKTWQPVKPESPSTVEKITLFYVELWKGKSNRYQGAFDAALACFHRADTRTRTSLLEDAGPELVCELADTYCELGNFRAAETLLESEFNRLDRSGYNRSKTWYQVLLSRAELLRRQGHTAEAKSLCLEVVSSLYVAGCPIISKYLQLRVFTLLGRIYQANNEWQDAVSSWNRSLSLSRGFAMGNGHTTQAILLSMKEVLTNLHEKQNGEENDKVLDVIDQIQSVKSGGCKFWIPGLNGWSKALVRKSEVKMMQSNIT